MPVVDVVIGGSPCQDLSVAGKRAGLSGERSGLYMEQIRIIKEMRERDKTAGRTGQSVRPRYMVWENVPGAFSSSKGEDFRAVLEEAARIADESTVIPGPPQGKWRTTGCIMGDGFSIAWRVLDAQFWGVPQRRRRIALVADFGGQSAPEILFVRKGVPGHSEPGGTAGKGLAGGTESGTSFAVRIRGGCDGGGKGALVQTEASGTLGCRNDQVVFCLQGNGIDRADTAGCNGKGWKEDVCYTLNTIDRPAVCAGFSASLCAKAHGIGYMDEQSPTLSSQRHDATVFFQPKSAMDENWEESDVKNALRAGESKSSHAVLCLNDKGGSVMDMNYDVFGMLRAQEHGHQPTVLDMSHACDVVRENMMVRRLTPLECERLQGFPDGWTDIGEWVDSKGKKRQTTDSARYKALGNSIALPPWKWVLKRLSAQYERDATMASLFDGIGGFPLIWEQLNGRGSCLWASEIDEYPIAVTKYHFGED